MTPDEAAKLRDEIRIRVAAWIDANKVDPQKAPYLENFVQRLIQDVLGQRRPRTTAFKNISEWPEGLRVREMPATKGGV